MSVCACARIWGGNAPFASGSCENAPFNSPFQRAAATGSVVGCLLVRLQDAKQLTGGHDLLPGLFPDKAYAEWESRPSPCKML